MSGRGTPSLDIPDGVDLKITVVASLWHDSVMHGLVAGALATLTAAGVDDPSVVRVPGAFELPLAAQGAAESCDAVVALGVVIRGGTPHFDYVCRAATDGLVQVSLRTGCPVGFGLLTCDTEEQALDRAGLPGSTEDKGAQATVAALTMVATMRDLRARARR